MPPQGEAAPEPYSAVLGMRGRLVELPVRTLLAQKRANRKEESMCCGLQLRRGGGNLRREVRRARAVQVNRSQRHVLAVMPTFHHL